MTAVLLALLTAVVWGLANYLGPLLARVHPLGAVLVAGQVVGVVGAAVLYAVDGQAPDARTAVFGVLSGLANGLALLTFYKAAAIGPISVVAPIGATGALVPVLLALAGGERPSVLQVVGIPLAVAGVALAAARAAAPAGEVRVRGGVVMSLLAALSFGTFLALFAEASQEGAPAAVLTSRVALLVGTLAVLAVARTSIRVPLRVLPRVAVPGALLLVGTVAYGFATGSGLVSVVSVLATLNPVVTVGLAVVVLGERLAPRQQVGVGAALLGVVLLAAG